MALNKMMMGSSGELPTVETYLLRSGTVSKTTKFYTITVPSGVTVLKLTINVNDSGDSQKSYTGAMLFRVIMAWSTAEATYGGSNTETTYIGVTPNELYDLGFEVDSTVSGSANFSLSYSASINQQTPTVMDYLTDY